MRFAAACLQHGSSLMRFLVQYGIIFAPGVSVFGRIINICAARYKFRCTNFLANSVNVNIYSLFRTSAAKHIKYT